MLPCLQSADANTGPVSRAWSLPSLCSWAAAWTLQHSGSSTLQLLLFTYIIYESRKFSVPHLMISKRQKVGHRQIFCLWEISAMRLVSVSPGQWLGGGVGCCSAALCVDMTSIFIFIDSIQRKRKSFSFMYWTLLNLIGPYWTLLNLIEPHWTSKSIRFQKGWLTYITLLT